MESKAQSARNSLKLKELPELAKSKDLSAQSATIEAHAYELEQNALQGKMDREEAHTQSMKLRKQAKALNRWSHKDWMRATKEYKRAIAEVNQNLEKEKAKLQNWAEVEATMATMTSTLPSTTTAPRTTSTLDSASYVQTSGSHDESDAQESTSQHSTLHLVDSNAILPAWSFIWTLFLEIPLGLIGAGWCYVACWSTFYSWWRTRVDHDICSVSREPLLHV